MNPLLTAVRGQPFVALALSMVEKDIAIEEDMLDMVASLEDIRKGPLHMKQLFRPSKKSNPFVVALDIDTYYYCKRHKDEAQTLQAAKMETEQNCDRLLLTPFIYATCNLTK